MNTTVPDLNYTHYSDPAAAGQQPPLLILHGLFGSATNWRSIARQLSTQQPVFALDLRNHGASFWDNTMDYPALADDVARFIEQHELGSVHIIGHSMGGKTAMTLALTRPELVDRLVVVDIAPVTYAHTHAPFIDALLQLDLTALSSRSQADQALHEAIPEDGVRQFLLQNLVQQDGTFRWRINLPILREAMPALIGFPELNTHYAGPALFLYGENSDYVLPRYTAAIERYFPNAQFQAVAGAGHWLHAEQPALMVETARQFFRPGA